MLPYPYTDHIEDPSYTPLQSNQPLLGPYDESLPSSSPPTTTSAVSVYVYVLMRATTRPPTRAPSEFNTWQGNCAQVFRLKAGAQAALAGKLAEAMRERWAAREVWMKEAVESGLRKGVQVWRGTPGYEPPGFGTGSWTLWWIREVVMEE